MEHWGIRTLAWDGKKIDLEECILEIARELNDICIEHSISFPCTRVPINYRILPSIFRVKQLMHGKSIERSASFQDALVHSKY